MDKLKILQINIGKGKAATILLENYMNTEKIVVILIQEQYKSHPKPTGYDVYRDSPNAKTVTWIREDIQGTFMRMDVSSENATTIQIGTQQIISNIYDEPGGLTNNRFDEIAEKLTNSGMSNILIAGDLNAKNELWGGNETDIRGQKLIEWSISNNYSIENNKRDHPTFDSNRGQSWIDVTMTKNLRLDNWKVEDVETLSDHRYISYNIYAHDNLRTKGIHTVYDFENTNWDSLAQHLKEHYSPSPMLNQQDIEAEAVLIQDIVSQACRRYIKKRIIHKDRDKDWWTGKLEALKKDLSKQRRRYKAETNDQRKQEELTHYKYKRNYYKKEIVKAKLEHIDTMLENYSETNPWYKFWKLVKTKNPPETLRNTKRDDGTYTVTQKETDEYLISKYFHTGTRPQPTYTKDNNNTGENYITTDAVQACCLTLKHKKATAEDRIPNEAMKTVFAALGEHITCLYNACVTCGYFPKIWKIASLVWLPKKDHTLRPISLLPTLGKILDKALNRKIQLILEQRSLLSDEQFGFRKGRSTIQAIERMNDVITRNNKDGFHSLVIALDLRNAFNSAWPPYLINQMEHMGLPQQIIRTCESFMTGRKVRTKCITQDICRGCPQGSSLGPTLWLIIMEGWFAEIRRAKSRWAEEKSRTEERQIEHVEDLCDFQAFADDQLVIVKGKSAKAIESKFEIIWQACKKWESDSKTTYNDDKTEMMFIPHTNIKRFPDIKIQGQRIEYKDEIKYLGLIIDKKQLYTGHVKYMRRKMSEVGNRLVGMAGRIYGSRKVISKTIYERAIKPALLYGFEIYGHKVNTIHNTRHLNALQRIFLLSMTSSYRTTSTAALQVIAGVPPLELEIRISYETYRSNYNKIKEEQATIYGTYITEQQDSEITLSIRKQKQLRKELNKEEVMKEWQKAWEKDSRGRKLYIICNEVGTESLKLTKKSTQIATDHGHFQAYLKRFGLRVDGQCSACGEEEDRDHLLFTCKREKIIRARNTIRQKYDSLDLQLRLDGNVNRKDVEKLKEWAEEIVKDDEFL